jgi:two-component system sensor histidine kinase/response regulator
MKFLETQEGTLPQIRAALAAKDPEALGRLAHSLKGGAGHIGAKDLEAAARDLETACRMGEGDVLADSILVTRLEEALRQVMASIRTLETPAEVPEVSIDSAAKSPEAQERVRRLMEALALADPEAIEERLQLAQSHLPVSTQYRLSNYITTYDYDQAGDLLRNFLSRDSVS